MGSGIFTFLCFKLFQNVSKQIESVDLDIFSLFQYVSDSLLYNLYVSMFRNTRIWGLEFSPFECFSMFRNVSKQLKVWT